MYCYYNLNFKDYNSFILIASYIFKFYIKFFVRKLKWLIVFEKENFKKWKYY